MAITFKNYERIIFITSPQTEVTIPDLYNAIRDYDDELDNFYMPKIANAYGKQELGGGTLVGITLELLDWRIQFQARDGPSWIVCNVTGGNIVSLDYNGVAQTPVVGSAYVSPAWTASSSATLQEQEAIQYSSYQNGIWVDTAASTIGTDYPAGTRSDPVNNIQDAVNIAGIKGFDTIYLLSDITLDSGDDIQDMTIIGRNPVQTTLTINTAALTQNCEIKECTVTGILDGGLILERCNLGTLNYVNGELHSCILKDVITLAGASDAYLINCASGVAGTGVPSIDMGASGQGLQVRNYNGGLEILNKSGADDVSVDMNSGNLILDSTVTAGTIVVRGTGQLTDNSTGTALIISHYLNNPFNVRKNLISLLEGYRPHHKGSGNVYYWDPYGGDDAWDGISEKTAVKTFAQAHSLVKDNNHDVIFCISGDPSGVTIANEVISITKNYVFVRGSGKGFQLVPTSTIAPTINITGDGCEISGLVIKTAGSGSQNAIMVSNGDFPLLKNLWVEDANGNGIELSDTNNVEIENCVINGCAGDGIKANNNIADCIVEGCHLDNNGGHNVNLLGSGIYEFSMKSCNIIHNAGGYGINIGTGSDQVYIDHETTFITNVAGDINDNGTSTYNGLVLGPVPEIAKAVWNEQRAAHLTGGSFGEGVIVFQNLDKSDYNLDTPTVNDIADKVWDELIIDHQSPGSTGEALEASDVPSLSAIAGAVWDEGRAPHALLGSFGEGIPKIIGNIEGDIEGTLASVDTVVNAVTVGTNNDKTGYALSAADKNDIADRIWDEQLSDHVGAGSMGEALGNADAIADIAAIADAVWDEARAGHIIAGSFGEGIASVQGNIDGDLNGNVLGTVASIVANVTVGSNLDKSGYFLDSSEYDNIVDAVWDEPISNHQGAGSTGKALSDADAVADAAAIADAVWDEARAGHVGAGTFGEGIASVQGDIVGTVQGVITNVTTVGSVTNGVIVDTNNDKAGYALSAAEKPNIVDDIWDELLSGHVSVGTAGKALSDSGAVADPAAIADAVWDEARSAHVGAGSFGEGIPQVMGDIGGDISGDVIGSVKTNVEGDVQGGVLGAVASVTAGVTVTTNNDKTGYSLIASEKADIADRVWNEARADHSSAGSFGEGIPKIIGDILGDLAGNVGGNIAGSVASVIAGVTVSINSDKTGYTLTSADKNDIADRVWDEMIADHVGAGSTGEALSTGGISPSVIADAVWDEARSSHSSVGSFGEGIASVRGNLIGNVGGNILGYLSGNVQGDIEGDVLGSVNSIVGAVTVGTNNDKTGYSLSVSQLNTIADKVWDELRADHIVADSFGEGIPKIIGDVEGDVLGSVDNIVNSVVVSSVLDKTGYALVTSEITTIVDLVWDEARADHTAVGSFGEGMPKVMGDVEGDVLGDIKGNVDGSVASIVASVVVGTNNDKSGYSLVTAEKDDIADRIWDEARSGHVIAGSFGEGVLVESISNPVTVGANNDKTGYELTQGDKDSIVADVWTANAILALTQDLHDEAMGKWVLDPTGNTMTLYKADGVTPLKVFDLTPAAAEVPAYIERAPQ